MILVADESVEYPIVFILRESRFDVVSIREENRGCDDETVLSIAFEKKALLLTMDKDFGFLTFRLNKPNHGIVLCRFRQLSTTEKAERIIKLFNTQTKSLMNKFTVLSNDRIRMVSLFI